MTCDETFELLARGDETPTEKRATDEHLATCAECRTMKDGLAAYDEAMSNPRKFERDPLPVQQAILAKARARAAEYRREGPSSLAPPAPARAVRILRAAAVVALILAVGFAAGRLTAPEKRVLILPEEGPTVGIHSGARSTPK